MNERASKLEIPPVIETLTEIHLAIDYVREHLSLLEMALKQYRGESMIDLTGILPPFDGSPEKANLGTRCGIPVPLPWPPQLDECYPLLIKRGTEQISIKRLSELAGRASNWCDAIRERIGGPIPRPSNSLDRPL